MEFSYSLCSLSISQWEITSSADVTDQTGTQSPANSALNQRCIFSEIILKIHRKIEEITYNLSFFHHHDKEQNHFLTGNKTNYFGVRCTLRVTLNVSGKRAINISHVSDPRLAFMFISFNLFVL